MKISKPYPSASGIKKMIEEERNCFDILKQVSAVNGALKSLQKVMLEQHMQICLIEAIKKDGARGRIVEELVKHLSELQA